MSKVVYTKRCSDGTACSGWAGSPAYIPDEYEICDFCLLAKYDKELGGQKYDGCGDPLSMDPLYSRGGVVAALRKAEMR